MFRASVPLLVLSMVALALSGCLGDDDPFDPFAFKETGREVELVMWVEDVEQEIWPGFQGSFWAFCAAPYDSEDMESRQAIEYQSQAGQCSVPGPTIRVTQGDRVTVHFENPHGFPHTVHWHGQTLPNGEDGVPGATQDTVTPETNFTYSYVASRPGTLMYHCHVDTQHHVFMGLYGAIIVEPQDRRFETKVDVDKTLVLSHANKDMMDASTGGHDHAAMMAAGGGGGGSGTPGAQNAAFDPDPDVFMINGRSFPSTIEDPNTLVKVEEGDTVRLRLVNIGFLPETMHLHGHDMLVTHKDGLPLSKAARYHADTLRLDPGERYDVIVKANNPGKWVMHTHYPNHVTNAHQYPGGMLTQFLYAGFEDQRFAAELPGGIDTGQAPIEESGQLVTVFDKTFAENVTDAEWAASYKAPVEVPHDGRIYVTFALEPGSPLDGFSLQVEDPDGAVMRSRSIEAGDDPATIVVDDLTEAGNHTVTVEGTGIQASYTLQVEVAELHVAEGGTHQH